MNYYLGIIRTAAMADMRAKVESCNSIISIELQLQPPKHDIKTDSQNTNDVGYYNRYNFNWLCDA